MRENAETPKLSLKAAYAMAVGAPAGGIAVMTLLWPASLFIASFAAAALAIPVSLEIYKNGKDNVLTHAGAEYKEALNVVVTDIKTRLGKNTPQP